MNDKETTEILKRVLNKYDPQIKLIVDDEAFKPMLRCKLNTGAEFDFDVEAAIDYIVLNPISTSA